MSPAPDAFSHDLAYQSRVDLPVAPVAWHTIRAHLWASRILAGLVTAVAALVLLGWAADVEVLKTLLHPARIAMNPLAAVGFILASVALQLQVSFPLSRPRRLATDVVSAVVLGIGVVQVLAHAGLPLDLDQVLFHERLGENEMAPNTAFTFVIVGMALLLVDRRVFGGRPTPLLALGALVITLLALLGYLYDIRSLYRLHGFIAMALNTAACFFALSLAILAARPAHPPLSTLLSNTVGGVLTRRLLPAAVLVPVVVGYVSLLIVRRDRYDPEMAVLLFTLTTIAVFVALTSWTADRLHRLDLANRQVVERLQSAEAVYHSLVETLPQNIFRKDLAGKFTFGNRNFCQTLGRPLEQIVGRTDFDFYAPELAARYRHDDLDVARRGKAMDVIEEHVTAGGDRLYVQVIKTPVRAVDGTIIGVQGIFWDVTDRVVAQQALEEKNEALQQANGQLELANEQLERAVSAERAALEQLRKAQTHLVQSEKMVGLGQMVAGVAHEINNPLAFVSNNVAVLQRDAKALGHIIDLYRSADDRLEAVSPELMAEIGEEAEAIDLDYTRRNLDDMLVRSREGLRRIQQIVRDLRDFVRLDESDLQEVDLNAGVESTLNIIAGHAKKKQVRLETDLAPLPPVACYPAKVNQVIMNLVSNAIDASHEGGRVVIRSRPGEPPDHVLVEVSDEGTGIPDEVRQRIFDPFFTTKPVGKGTGLGLSISYGIIRDHGGRIDVESEAGRGTTFRITLPVKGPSPAEVREQNMVWTNG